MSRTRGAKRERKIDFECERLTEVKDADESREMGCREGTGKVQGRYREGTGKMQTRAVRWGAETMQWSRAVGGGECGRVRYSTGSTGPNGPMVWGRAHAWSEGISWSPEWPSGKVLGRFWEGSGKGTRLVRGDFVEPGVAVWLDAAEGAASAILGR